MERRSYERENRFQKRDPISPSDDPEEHEKLHVGHVYSLHVRK
jgi:hypothetical protein